MSLRKSQKICDNKSSEQEPSDLTLEDTKPQQRVKGYNKLSRREKELKVIHSVSNKLSGKAFTKNLQTFQAPGGLVQKDVRISSDLISIKFSSPLSGICSPHYIKRWACEDLIADQTDNESKNTPSVKAVKLNWKRGIKFENVSRYSRQNKLIEPEMTTIDFDFESKIKFQKELQSTSSELFPENNISVLDGNDCHGLVVLKSKKGVNKEEESGDDTSNVDQDNVIYVDQDEHEVLLVPFHSKAGYDPDISKRYKFPYNAKFVVNKKNYEHKFELRLAMDKAPQHFGLIFTFPDPSNPLKSLIVKSLLTVYSVFPTSQRHAKLVIYAETVDTNSNSKGGERKPKKSFTKNLNNTISTKLTEENLNKRMIGIGCSINANGKDQHSSTIEYGISHTNQKLPFFYTRKLDTGDKQKDKQKLSKSLKTEARSVTGLSNISVY